MIVRLFELSHIKKHGEIIIVRLFESYKHKKEQPHWKNREKTKQDLEDWTLYIQRWKNWNLKIEHRTYNIGVGRTQK